MARWMIFQERANPGAGAAAAHLSLSAEDAEATAVLLTAAGVPVRIFFEPPGKSGGCAAFEQVSPETMKRRAMAERQERGAGSMPRPPSPEENRINTARLHNRVANAALVELQRPGLSASQRRKLRETFQAAEKAADRLGREHQEEDR